MDSTSSLPIQIGKGERLTSPLGGLPPLILTPHPGEFRRLFPHLSAPHPAEAAQQAASQSGALVVLKGARVVIARPDGSLAINPESTPALARGGVWGCPNRAYGGVGGDCSLSEAGDRSSSP